MMRIWNGIASYPADMGPVAASIGNFDGLHLGHQAILHQLRQDARDRGLPSLLITFEPHPLQIVAPERKPTLLQTRRQKLESIEGAGLTDVVLIDFRPEIAELSGEAFFERVIGGPIELAAIHVGANFRFGRGRSGDLELLRKIGESRGFEVFDLPAVELEGQTVSSSRIRTAVAGGDVELARRMLDRPYSLTGVVTRGDGRGAALQFPTANLNVDNDLVPRHGVYITQTTVLASRFSSVTNVGVRPTFDRKTLTVETHLLDFDADLYGERADVHFLARLRDEIRFKSPGELADQIGLDRAAAESYFSNVQVTRTGS